MLSGRELLIGITGGVAAFKTAALVSQLVQAGAGVQVVMTESAERFIGPATFEALTGRKVYRQMFDNRELPLGAHITLSERAELLCVAPASANFLAHAASGLADDLLSTLYLAYRGPVLVAPAMNAAMWEHPAVVRNVERLQQDGVLFVAPESGWLSCRQVGTGRMAPPDRIQAAIEQVLRESTPRGSGSA